MTLSKEQSTGMAVAKGIAIIAMVAGHAEGPALLTNFIYTWHMPLFFMAAGYFFSERSVDDPWSFISKRFQKLYLPFLKWSILFLLLHNIFFHFGILNEEYGNWTGGVTHPYTLKSAAQRLVLMVTAMAGYDEFMAGAFWFFRGLLVASIVFLILYRLLRTRTPLHADLAVTLVCALCVAFAAFRLFFSVKLSYYPNGGWREIWGVFFFGAGVLYRRYEHLLPRNFFLLAIGLALMLGAGWLHLSGMNNSGAWRDLYTLPLTGCIGFYTVHSLSCRMATLAPSALATRTLAYIGANTMPVFVFHIISYKPVSLLKIWWYGLDFHQVGCHMVIHHNSNDLFFWLYTLVGTALPLLVAAAWKRARRPAAAPTAA